MAKPRKKPAAPAPSVDAPLLADVLARPQDDGPRLVLADWLAEQGDPRGELISLQIALATPLAGARGHVIRHRGKEVSESQEAIEARVK
jgi:uncharacterized protein (TIGR02996 family)